MLPHATFYKYGGGEGNNWLPLPPYLKLSVEDNPTSDDEKVEMAKFPYASVVGSLIYSLVVSLLMGESGKKPQSAEKPK